MLNRCFLHASQDKNTRIRIALPRKFSYLCRKHDTTIIYKCCHKTIISVFLDTQLTVIILLWLRAKIYVVKSGLSTERYYLDYSHTYKQTTEVDI